MNQTPPSIQSTVRVSDASAGLIEHWSLSGQSGDLKLNGSARLPGPWKVNVSAPVLGPSGQEGGVVTVDIGYYDLSDLATLGAAAQSGVQYNAYGAGNDTTQQFYLPSGGGSVPPSRSDLGIGTWASFYFYNAQAFNPFIAQLIGPSGEAWWTGLPVASDPGWGNHTVFPDGIDTANVEPDPYGTSQGDPLADFDHPVVALFLRGWGTFIEHMAYELCHPQWTDPPSLLRGTPGESQCGAVTLYNDITAQRYPLIFGGLSDTQLGIGPPMANVWDPTQGRFIDVDASAWSGWGMWAYADVAQTPDAPTGAIGHAQADAGLVAVG